MISFELPESALTVKWTRGCYAALGLSDGQLGVVKVGPSATIDYVEAHKNGVQCLEWSEDDDGDLVIATGGQDGHVVFWKLTEGNGVEKIGSVKLPNKWVQSITWLKNRVVAANGKQVYLINSATLEYVAFDALKMTVNHVHVLDNLIYASTYSSVIVYDPESMAQVLSLDEKGSMLHAAAMPYKSAQGKHVIVTGMQDEMIMVWATVQKAKALVAEQKLKLQGYAGKISSVAISPSKRYIASTGAPVVVVWDTNTDHQFIRDGQLKQKVCVGIQEMVQDIAFHPTKDYVAAVGKSGRVMVWDAAQPGIKQRSGIHVIPPHDAYDEVDGDAINIAFSLNGKYIAITFEDGRVVFYPFKTL